MNQCLPIVIAAVASLARALEAQTVGAPILIDKGIAGTVTNTEAAIIASPFNEYQAAVAWIHSDSTAPANMRARVKYSTCLDGVTFTAPRLVPDPATDPCPFTQAGDPMVAASFQTGDLYVGELRDGGWFVLARKPLNGSDLLTPSAQASACDEHGDKEFLAIGPWPAAAPPHTTNEVAYIAYYSGPGRRVRSSDVLPVATGWPTSPGSPGAAADIESAAGPLFGRGHFPVVLRSGDHPGRLVVGYSEPGLNPGGVFSLPRWTYTDTAGEGLWQDEQVIDRFGPVGTGDPIFNVIHPVDATHMNPYVPIPGSIQVFTWPSLAVDPTVAGRIWAVFVGRDFDLSTDLNLFIAHSDDGGTSFPAANVVQISDAQLRLTGEPALESDEYMPSITIDSLGGINILFLRTTDDDSTPTSSCTVFARYARWKTAAALAAHVQPFVANVFPSGFHPWPSYPSNDYQMITSSGCTVYCGFAAQVDGAWDAYVTRILVDNCAIADADASATITTDDPLAYFSAFAAGLPAADVNNDQAVTAADGVIYLNAYNAAPHP